MFAVFEAKGFQYLGSPGEKLKVPRLDSNIGEKVTFDKVLLVKNGDTKIGQPYIEGASITAEIIDHGRYKKIIVYKFKRRNRYRRKKGHRQTYSEIEIKDIILGGKITAKKEVKKEKEEVEKVAATEVKVKKAKVEAKKDTATKEAKKSAAKKKTSAKTATKAKKKTGEPKKEPKKIVKKKEAAAKKKSPLKSKKASDKTKNKKKSTGKTKKKTK